MSISKSGIVKAHRAPNNFFQGHTRPMVDPSLSYGAKGLLAYLMTKPEGWECRNHDLYAHSSDSKYRVNQIIAELTEHGYIDRHKESGGRGKLIWVTHVYELPELNPKYDVRYTNVDNTNVDNTNVDNTNVVCQTYSNNKYSNNKPSKNNSSQSQSVSQPNGKAKNKRTLAAAAAAELLELFTEAGISNKKQNELVACDWITPTYVTAHIAKAKVEGISVGLLITRMLDGDPAPVDDSKPNCDVHGNVGMMGSECLICSGVMKS